MRARDLPVVYPYHVGVTVLTLVAFGSLVAVWANLVPVSFSTVARLVSFTLFLFVVTLAAWAGPVIDWVRR